MGSTYLQKLRYVVVFIVPQFVVIPTTTPSLNYQLACAFGTFSKSTTSTW